MATIYRVKNGPSGDQTDEGRKMSASDLAMKLSNYQCRYLGKEPPQFNTAKPSYDYRYIVLEVTGEDEMNDMFNQVGFYVVADLDVINSGFLYEVIET